jgi:O-methyltransferase
LWFIWDYWPIVVLENIPFVDRLKLLKRLLRIDWNIVHGHLPSEIAFMCTVLASRKAKFDEVVVEAGCYKGGSAAKLSIICKMLGYRLLIYDSFWGVETPSLDQQKKETEWFFGKYAATEAMVRDNLEKYGEPEVCQIEKGGFKDTLANAPIPHRVRLAYIDCDLPQGHRRGFEGIDSIAC